MDQQKRFLLALVISGAILVIWQSFFAPPKPDVAPKDNKTSKVAKKDQGKTTTKEDKTKPDNKQTPNATKPAVPSKTVDVASVKMSTDMFTVGVTNQGGRLNVLSYLSPKQYQKAGNLLAEFPKGDHQHLPFALTFGQGNISLPDSLVYEIDPKKSVKDDKGNYTTVAMRYVEPAGKYTLYKTYSINTKHPYVVDLEVSLTNHDKSVLSDKLQLTAWGYKDPKKEKSFLDFRPSELEGMCFVKDDGVERTTFDGLKKPEVFKADVLWAGIGLRYFNYVAVFDKKPNKCEISKADKNYAQVRVEWDKFALATNEHYTVKQKLYLGPKDIDVMEKVHSELPATVDYGIFKFLAVPLHKALLFFYGLVKNWGLAIILLTLVIKLLTWPITEKSYANAERMKEIQPQLDELRSKYENDQQRLAEETMKLFQTNKFNPLGGCLPMVLQMPIFYGLYVMIVYSVELYQAEFFWFYTDLSSRDPYFILPILMGLTMVVQQRFMTVATPNAQTKLMMQLMPVMFSVFMLFLPSGLVLYYFLNLLLGVLQQWLIKRKFARRREQKEAAA